jgi:hypothetical protein
MSDTLNGYPVIGSFLLPKQEGIRDGRIILVDKGESETPFDRYVTAWHGLGDAEWGHGHYIHDFDAALDDFVKRIRSKVH